MMIVAAAVVGGLVLDHYRDDAQTFADPVEQFKYGSTGGDRLAGIPVGIFRALPVLCRDHLPGDGWQSLGFIMEAGQDRPVGTSLRHWYGFDRVSLNCAACHVGTYRTSEAAAPKIVVGMPAHRLDLGRFARFLSDCALDERFNPWQVIQAAEQTGARYSFLDRILLQWVVVPALKAGLILARGRFGFLDHEVAGGPGRFDTFGPAKALLNWPFDRLPRRQSVGIVDFPSLWLQGPREGMHLHWDGNNDSVAERNRSAAFGTGAVPAFADRDSLANIAAWLITDANRPPPFPGTIDWRRATRGGRVYAHYCADCHGVSGTDFRGAAVGRIEPIERVRTDPCRLDNYVVELAREQGNLYAAFPEERFRHFRKTHGYANLPLDGLWLRGPYLHNGSVPTVRDLLEPASLRPKGFWRGNDVIDPARLGFVSDVPGDGTTSFFRYETDADAGIACTGTALAGNGNGGHEGAAYGTDLPAEDKDALVEFLKTF